MIDNTLASLVHRIDLTVRPKIDHYVLLRGLGGLCKRLKNNLASQYHALKYNMFPLVWKYMKTLKNGGK